MHGNPLALVQRFAVAISFVASPHLTQMGTTTAIRVDGRERLANPCTSATKRGSVGPTPATQWASHMYMSCHVVHTFESNVRRTAVRLVRIANSGGVV